VGIAAARRKRALLGPVRDMTQFADRHWTSRDGLSLHYRDYAGRADRPVLLCLPGLTRNARDFENLAERCAGEWRVLCPDMRGRADSDYARDSATYVPMQYVDDVTVLLEAAGIDRFVAIGTSLGGLMTMAMAMTMGDRLAGALLNDVGPVLETAGVERIGKYVGQGRSFETWMHAARALEEVHAPAYPDYEIADWLAMAKRIMALSSSGRIAFDYDMKIAEPFASSVTAEAVDLWPGLAALAGKPALLVRGELSDILSAATFAEMQRRLPQAEAVTVARVGHAPTLDEPEVVAATARLLAKIA